MNRFCYNDIIIKRVQPCCILKNIYCISYIYRSNMRHSDGGRTVLDQLQIFKKISSLTVQQIFFWSKEVHFLTKYNLRLIALLKMKLLVISFLVKRSVYFAIQVENFSLLVDSLLLIKELLIRSSEDTIYVSLVSQLVKWRAITRTCLCESR